jgi:TDG/mug DNA glycosylase family protein
MEPIALADLHRSTSVDGEVNLTLPTTWSRERVHDVVVGGGFAPVAIAPDNTVRARRERTLPDTVGPAMRLLVCGLNPSLHAADAGVGFVTPGNRFWPAALEAGLVSRDRDPRHALLGHGLGMTDLVKRATPRADALTRDEYRSGVERLERLCAWLEPRAVCVVGLAGWRAAVDRKTAPGWQDRPLGGRPVYVMPSTSGLNAATSLRDLAEHLRRASART